MSDAASVIFGVLGAIPGLLAWLAGIAAASVYYRVCPRAAQCVLGACGLGILGTVLGMFQPVWIQGFQAAGLSMEQMTVWLSVIGFGFSILRMIGLALLFVAAFIDRTTAPAAPY